MKSLWSARSLWSTSALLIASVLAFGCGGTSTSGGRPSASDGGTAGEGANKETASILRHLGMAYLNYCDANVGGPASAEDLKKNLEEVDRVEDIGGQKSYDILKKGSVVLIYNIHIPSTLTAADARNTVLGYAKDTPSRGGPVLMADGSVKENVTSEEFKKLPQAEPKGK